MQEILNKWQKILRLQDWDIRLQLVEHEWRKSGDVKISLEDKCAILLINTCNPLHKNIEEIIVHELLHIKLWAMDQMVERHLNAVFGEDEDDPKRAIVYEEFMLTLESTVHDLTKSFIALGGEDKELSFGLLEQQVNEELKK